MHQQLLSDVQQSALAYLSHVRAVRDESHRQTVAGKWHTGTMIQAAALGALGVLQSRYNATTEGYLRYAQLLNMLYFAEVLGKLSTSWT